MSKLVVSRRQFLIKAGAGMSGLAIYQSAVAKPVVNLLDSNSPLIIPENFEPCVWFTMQSSGHTNVHIFNTEFGQHIGTALAQMVAEEMCLDWDNLSIDYPEMDSAMFNEMGGVRTGGSMGVLRAFEPLRRSAAIAREFLLEAGADSLGAEISDCYAVDGYVVDTAYDTRVSYGQILSERQIEHRIAPEELLEAKLKNPDDYTIIGQSKVSLDIPEKVNGSARYGIDAYAPNTIYGKASLAPTRLSSTIRSIDDSEAEEIPGYIDTLSIPTRGGGSMGSTDVALVLAKSFPAAMRAEKLIKVDWDVAQENMLNEDDLWLEAERIHNEEQAPVSWLKVGDMQQARESSDDILEAEYRTAMIEHAALEPRSALVQPIDGTFHIYSGHQAGGDLIQFIAKELSLPLDKVVYHPHLIGGSFGDKFYADQIVLAAVASKRMNRPVKVILTREDQFNLGHPKSISLQRMQAAISNETVSSPSQRVKGLRHDVVTAPASPVVRNGKAYANIDAKEFKVVPGDVHSAMVTGSDHWYDIDAVEANFYSHEMMQRVMPTGSVRSVGNYFTVFAVESFIDEIADKIDVDPLTLRLSLLKGRGRNAGPDVPDNIIANLPKSSSYVAAGGGARLANVLRVATGQANYGSPLIIRNKGQGIAVAAAEGRHNPSFSACVAQVSLTQGGNITVEKLTVCADVGMVVNPDGVRAQIEGSLMWGLSSAYLESTTLQNGRLKDTNFDSYKWQRNMQLPELDIHVVGNGGVPSGIGENTMSLVAPAVCNAVFALTGKRLRTLPLSQHLPLTV